MKLCRRLHGSESSPSIPRAFCASYKDNIPADSRPIRVDSRWRFSGRFNRPALIRLSGGSHTVGYRMGSWIQLLALSEHADELSDALSPCLILPGRLYSEQDCVPVLAVQRDRKSTLL